ncbi:MAG: hypothetical protein AB1444_03425 [Spirochaetota bacterium]
MKKVLIFMCICILSFSVYASAQIAGTAMGGISTVTSEGAIDTTRNPALLGTLPAASTSLYLMGNVYYNENSNPEFNASGLTIYSIKQENDYNYFISLFAGYAKPAGNGAIGYSLSSKENLYSRRKDTQTLKGSIPPDFVQTETTTTNQINPTLSVAYGWKLSDNTFTGIQLEITPFFSNKKTDNNNSLGTSYSYTKQEYGVIIQPSLGFLLISNDSQVGLQLSPSTIKCVKKKADADFTGTKLSYSDSWDIQQSEGPKIVAGGYSKIHPHVGLALEFGLFLPYSYTNTDINVTDNPLPAINHSSLTINNDPIVSMKGGFQYVFTEKLECMAGIAFFHFLNTAGNSKSYGKGKINFTLITFATNYSFSSAIVLSTMALITNSAFESYYHVADTMSLDAKTKINSWNVTVGAGLSYRL